MSAAGSGREPLEKLAEEFAGRVRGGERPSLTEYTDRYPELAEEIRRLFPALVLMEKVGSLAGQPTGPEPRSRPDAGPVPQQLGDYRILRKVGQGGMGVVYEAVQESLGRHVALKVLPFHALLNATALERFRRESRAAARLHHTNIVPVFAVGEQDGIHYYAMQFIQGRGLDAVLQELKQLRDSRRATPGARGATAGGDLSAAIARGLVTGCFPRDEAAGSELTAPGVVGPPGESAGAVSPPETAGPATPGSLSDLAGLAESQFYRSVAQVGVQVAEALAYAHQQGVLHRDIKPSNLLLDTRGTVWVTDLGLAKTEGTDELTSPGDIVGTIRYMAPECFQGRADPRSDVYSLGATLYELLTLSPAFDDTNRARLIERVTRQDPPRPRQRDPRIPPDLETIVLKAITKEPAGRYAGAAAFADDLRCFLTDRPIQARRSSPVEQAWRWCRRNPAVAGLTAAVAGSLLLGAVLSMAFALAAREKAADAERNRQEAVTNLYHSLVREARALRLARESGYCAEAWERLRQARGLETPERNLDELRDEAVACMGDFVGLEPSIWNVPGIGKAGGQRLALHPDGAQLALGLDDGTVVVRNLATGKEVPLHKHGADVSAVAFTPDGTKLVTGDVHGAVHVWQLGPAGQWTWSRELRADPPLERPFFGNDLALAISPDSRYVAACPAPATAAVVWDLADGHHVRLEGGEGEQLRGVAWSPDGHTLAVARNYGKGGGRGVLRWDVARGRWADHPWPLDELGHISMIAFSPDGSLLAAGCQEGFGVYDTSDFRPRIQVRGDQARCLTFSPDSRWLFVTSEAQGTVQMWDLNATRQLAALQLPLGPSAVALSKDGRTLFAASRESVHSWKLPDTEEKLVLSAHTKTVPGLAFSPDGRLLASASKDRTVRIWNPVTGEKVKALPAFQGEIQAVAFSPDSRMLATADWAGELRLWDVQTWQDLDTVPERGHSLGNMIWSVRFSPDQTWLAASSWGRGLQVWRVRGRGLEAPPQTVVDRGHITAFTFSPDSKLLAWISRGDADAGYQTSLCNMQDLRPRSFPARPYGFVKATLAFTPDSRNLRFVSDQGVVEAWDVGSPPQKVAAYGTGELVSGNGAIAWTADGARLASSGNRTVTIWDTASRQIMLTLPGERSGVSAMAWSPDGDLLAMGSADGGLVIWNIPKIHSQLRTLGLER